MQRCSCAIFSYAGFLRLIFAAMLCYLPATLWAQAYPSRPITFVVPYGPAGSTDPISRQYAAQLEKVLGVEVNVENKPGGSQVVGGEYLKTQAPDGHSMMMYSHAIVAVDLQTRTTFNLLNDTVQFATVAGSGLVLTVPANSTAKTLREFVAYAKARPGKVNEGTVGANGVNEVRKLWVDLGLDIQKVPYKGGSNTIAALAAGEIDLYAASPLDVVQLAKAGKVIPIGYTETQRHPLFPDVPTAAETLGMPGYEARYYFGIAGPKGVPAAIVTRINRSVIAAIDTPEVKEKLDLLGLRSYKDSPEQLVANLQKARAETQAMIAAGIIKPDL